MRGIDQLAALGGVFLRKQDLLRNLAEFRIAIVAVAVGKGQFYGFNDGAGDGAGDGNRTRVLSLETNYRELK